MLTCLDRHAGDYCPAVIFVFGIALDEVLGDLLAVERKHHLHRRVGQSGPLRSCLQFLGRRGAPRSPAPSASATASAASALWHRTLLQSGRAMLGGFQRLQEFFLRSLIIDAIRIPMVDHADTELVFGIY